MATPIIQSTGSVSGAGVPGQGRNNLAPGETVTLSDAEPSNVGATYFWAFEDVPLGTAPVLTGHTTATPTFVTDPSALKAGSYRVRCTVNGTFFAVEVLAVPLATTGARIPSYEEEGEYDGGGNSKGWHEALTGFMRAADQGLGATVPVSRGGTGVTTVPTNGQLPIGNGTGYTVAALTAGANVTITNGPGTITIASTGGGGGGAVVFDDSVPGTDSNIRSDRAADQSPVDNTKARITNFGSQDLTVNPAATGATGDASTISGGLDNTASGDYSVVAGGAGNIASGDCSHAEGQGATASGTNSHAEGFGTTASGDSSHAEGINCFATGDYAHAEGSNTQAINNAAHSEGQATIASADGAHAEGGSTTASGTNSHAEGESTVASNAGSHAEGGNTVASGTYSHAKGFRSKASRTSQSAQAGGSFVSLGSVEGAAQTSVLVLSGETPGVATNESVELAYNDGADALVLEDKVAYSFNVTATIGALVLGVGKCRTIKLEFVARREGGLTTIAALGPSSSYGDATTNTWTLNVSVGAAPDRIVLTFDTGLSLTQCYVSARVEFTEVKFTV